MRRRRSSFCRLASVLRRLSSSRWTRPPRRRTRSDPGPTKGRRASRSSDPEVQRDVALGRGVRTDVVDREGLDGKTIALRPFPDVRDGILFVCALEDPVEVDGSDRAQGAEGGGGEGLRGGRGG